MAVVKGTSVVDQAHGRIGSLVHSTWKGKPYVRTAAPTINNPQTPAQQAIRTALTEASKMYTKLLTDEERAIWQQYAQEKGTQSDQMNQSIGGQGITPQPSTLQTGINAFVGTVAALESAGYSHAEHVNTVAPLGVQPPSAPANLTATFNPVTSAIEVSYDKPSEAGGIDAYEDEFDDLMLRSPKTRVWVQPPNMHTRIDQINEIPGNNAPNEECIIDIATSPERIPLVPGLYRIQIDCVDGFGQIGPPSNLVTVYVPLCCVPPNTETPLTLGYSDPYFSYQFPVTEVDGVCLVDFVQFSIMDPNEDKDTWYIPRAEWVVLSPTTLEARVYWPSAAAGDYTLVVRYGTFCGRYSEWTTPEVIPVVPE